MELYYRESNPKIDYVYLKEGESLKTKDYGSFKGDRKVNEGNPDMGLEETRDSFNLTKGAEIGKTWQKVDPTGYFEKRYKNFDINSEGKFNIQTFNGSENVCDPAQQTTTARFDRNGHSYEVTVNWKDGLDNAKVTKLVRDEKEIQEGGNSYIDNTKAYIYEGTDYQSEDGKTYFPVNLTKFNEDFFKKTLDQSVVSDPQKYNTVLKRFNELEQENKTAPFDDKQRNEMIDSLTESIKSELPRATKTLGRGYSGNYFWPSAAGDNATELAKPSDINNLYNYWNNGFLDELAEGLPASDKQKFEGLKENIAKLKNLYDCTSNWGPEENFMKQKEFNLLQHKLEEMRNDIYYQNNIKDAIQKNELPGIIIG